MADQDPAHAVERKQSVAGIFHRASSSYDQVGPNFFSHFGRHLVQHAELPRSGHVLDVACGRGAVLFPAAEAVGTNGFVNGIDLAQGMVEQTSREAASLGLSHVEVQQMDAEHLEFPDATFDTVLSGFAIFFFPQLDHALREFRRVLKPGGQVAVSTWGNKFDKDWEWFDRLKEKYLPPVPREADDSQPSDEVHFDTSEGMQKILTDAGFAEIQAISETADFIYATKDEWWESLWSHGGRGILERIERTGGSQMLARFRTDCMGQFSGESENIRRSFHVLYTFAKRP